jgi:hypothetical protein
MSLRRTKVILVVDAYMMLSEAYCNKVNISAGY